MAPSIGNDRNTGGDWPLEVVVPTWWPMGDVTQGEFDVSNETAAMYYAIGLRRRMANAVADEANKVSFKDPKNLSRVDAQALNPLSGVNRGLEGMLSKMKRSP
jgi:hypothetical protein